MSPNRLFAGLAVATILILAAATPWFVHELVADPELGERLDAWWLGGRYLGEDGVIRQRTASDCGVTCLEMVLERRGTPVAIEQLRLLAGTDAVGSSLLGLRKAARASGLQATTWRISRDDFAALPLPAIAFFGGNHFVVLDHWTPEGDVVVLDPARGRLVFSTRQLFRHWNGETLVIEPFRPQI